MSQFFKQCKLTTGFYNRKIGEAGLASHLSKLASFQELNDYFDNLLINLQHDFSYGLSCLTHLKINKTSYPTRLHKFMKIDRITVDLTRTMSTPYLRIEYLPDSYGSTDSEYFAIIDNDIIAKHHGFYGIFVTKIPYRVNIQYDKFTGTFSIGYTQAYDNLKHTGKGPRIFLTTKIKITRDVILELNALDRFTHLSVTNFLFNLVNFVDDLKAE